MENKNLNPVQKTIVGVQFLFVAFGATVLVPLLVGMDPSGGCRYQFSKTRF